MVDRFEDLAQIAGEWVGGGDDVLAGLDLDGSVAAGGLYELAPVAAPSPAIQRVC